MVRNCTAQRSFFSLCWQLEQPPSLVTVFIFTLWLWFGIKGNSSGACTQRCNLRTAQNLPTSLLLALPRCSAALRVKVCNSSVPQKDWNFSSCWFGLLNGSKAISVKGLRNYYLRGQELEGRLEPYAHLCCFSDHCCHYQTAPTEWEKLDGDHTGHWPHISDTSKSQAAN